ncbi:MAG: hypothetical protein N3G75_06385 [Methanothrix sp.]|nr:hypothetical protein [Methanothrix sp.]MCX8207443.1 hypothetical protein [Methanothrix sp.]
MPAPLSWEESIQAELRPGERIEANGYSIELFDISVVPSNPAVLLKIYDKYSVSSAVVNEGEVFVLRDERNREKLGIKLKEVSRADYLSNESWAVLGISMKSRPEIVISMSSERDVYHIGDQIKVDVFVENRGDGDAESIRLHLDLSKFQSNPTGPQRVFSKIMRRSLLRSGELWKERVSLRAPGLPETGSIELVATAEYLDADGNLYRSECALPVKVAGPVELHKHVHEIQTFGRTYYVIDTIRNTGDIRLNLSFRDAVGEEFQCDTLPEENFDLIPGETRIVSYAVMARRPGEGLVLPPAECTYSVAGSTYSVISESPVVDVIGPKIEASWYEINERDPDVFQICMNVKNSGNRYAGIRAYRIFPNWIEVLSGNNDLSFGLAAGSSRAICWSIRCLNGSCELPSLDLIYFDSENNMFRCEVPPLKLEKRSQKIVNMSRNNSTETSLVSIDNPIEMMDVEPPHSGFALALILLIASLVWLRTLRDW